MRKIETHVELLILRRLDRTVFRESLDNGDSLVKLCVPFSHCDGGQEVS